MQKDLFPIQTEEKPSPPKKQKRSSGKENFKSFGLTIHLTMALNEAENENVPFDKEAFCKRKGYTIQEVDAAIENILTMQEKIDREREAYEPSLADKELELTGWPLPSEEILPDFDSDLKYSSLFEILHTMNPAEQFSKITNGSSDAEIREQGILAFVENLFTDYFEENAVLILMNSFFWLLYYNGKRWLPVRSYAIEMLKLFPQDIQKSFFNDTIFIEEFSTFIKKRLATRGICSLKARPTPEEVEHGLYAIKATDAFYSLLRPSEEAIMFSSKE